MRSERCTPVPLKKDFSAGWFHLNGIEEQALEDGVVEMLEAKEEVELDEVVEPVM